MLERNKRAEAIASLKALLAEHPYGGVSFKDKLSEYEALKRQAFGHLEADGQEPKEGDKK